MFFRSLLLPLFVAISIATPASASNLAEGKALSVQCSACHGKDGISKDPEAPNLAGQSALYLEKQLVDYKKGARQDRRMSLIAGSLDKDQIKSLAAYYAAFQISVTPPPIE